MGAKRYLSVILIGVSLMKTIWLVCLFVVFWADFAFLFEGVIFNL